MAEKRKKPLISHGTAAQNRRARFDYKVGDTIEAGMVLLGPEVKSLRAGRASLGEAWAGERDGEIWLFGCHISEWQAGSVVAKFDPVRPRKLLLHKKQVRELTGAVTREGATLVPLEIRFNDQGRAKCIIALATGKKQHDKRADIAKRDWQRDKARLLRDKS
ncbi:SsrA-binding protein SmpB [Sabulicella glaciei]|uniref:SsrA-binding protein n=1 Tax=Sabulicella glaciei TaxID=2984948 RepID=A0ABT3NWL8_9PROT|nr:SsrA-binding protein SmpB [Roseococcus sp. MDT2-1-1]MCW8086533.1 SsrA-binding protein SmpB [Roseococcus sp. MDT2-1-1]